MTSETKDTTYNGWTNYETWAVNLHLTNEPYTSEELTAIATMDEPLHVRMDTLKEFTEDLVGGSGPVEDLHLLAQDLLRSALSSVDWREIVTNHEDDNNY